MINDWSTAFLPALVAWLTGQDPYTTNQLFASPPWALFVLAPLVWVPPWLAMFLPALALLYCAWRVRKPWLIPLVGLSFPFIAGSVYANIDWLVMVGVVIGGRLGIILNTVKPQAGAFVVFAELSKRKTWRARAVLLLPLIVLALVTIPLYGSWLHYMRQVGLHDGTVRNFSLFPYSIPLGVAALVYAWRRQSAIAGVIASLAFSPYWYIHSLIPLLFLLSAKNWRYGLTVNVGTWGVLAMILLGILPIDL